MEKEPKAKKPGTVYVPFRFAPETVALLEQRAGEAGISKRAWIEDAVVNNRTTIIARKKPHPDLRALLFQISRAGNNINQLAYKFNLLHKMGEVGADEYGQAIARLDDIAESLREALEHAR